MLFYSLLMIGSITVAFTLLAVIRKLSGLKVLFTLLCDEFGWHSSSLPKMQRGFVEVLSKKPAKTSGQHIKKPWGW